MKKRLSAKSLLAAAALLAATPCDAQPPLDSLYEQLRSIKTVQADSVRYTGSNFKKAGGGFAWQRGTGQGWTTGCRLTLTGVGPREAEKVRNAFKELQDKQFVQLSHCDKAATFDEKSQTAYLYAYTPDSRTLYFLRASTTGEICVPIAWTTLAYVDARERDPFAAFSERQRRQLGLARLWAEAKRNFVFMSRVRLDWDSLYVATMPLVDAAKDDAEYARILQRMAARLGDGHTYVYPTDCWTAPLTTKLLEGRVYVDRVESSRLDSLGIRRGMEIKAVNGETPLDYARRVLAPYVSSSTPQWTLHETLENYGLLKTCNREDTLRIDFANAKGKTLSLTYAPGSLSHDRSAPRPTFEYKVLQGNIGYLRIRDFMSGSFREDFDKLYARILKSSALIIDLRGNGGGNSGNSEYVLRHLTADSIRTGAWSSTMYIPAFASWGQSTGPYRAGGNLMAPYTDKELYLHPLAVLTDAGTFSAAEDFCATFSSMNRGPVIGAPTGGSTGNGVRIELLAGKLYANICSKHDVAPDGTEFVGRGLRPDVCVEETYGSWFKDKADAAVSAALQYLRTKK